jgi:hypothetical protein
MLVLGVCVTAGLADELKLKKVPAYPTPTITGYADGMVTFRTQTTSGSKSLADVDVIKLAGQEAFNKAEDLFDKGDFAGAAKGFDSVPEAADRPWLAKLAKGRRLQSLGQAGMIEQAAKEWMAQLVAAKGASPVFAMMPKKFGAKGSAENKAAIVLLEKQIAASKDASVVSSLKQLLSGVYEAQGDSAKAAALREADDAGQATSGPDKEPAAQESAGPTVTIGLAQLKAYEGLVQNNKGADVVGHLTPPALRSLSSPSDLAMALLILGKAQLQVAKGVTVKDDNALADRNDKLRQAGVSFMRVAVFSSNSPDQATEALFCAGEVCSLMGDQDAATRAYETIVQNYQETDSPKAMEFVKKAQAILGKAK